MNNIIITYKTLDLSGNITDEGIYDYEFSKYVSLEKMSKLEKFIVSIDYNSQIITFGAATPCKWKNIKFRIINNLKEQSFSTTQQALSKDIFSDDLLIWCPRYNGYVLCNTPEEKATLVLINKTYKRTNFFPYDMSRVYGAEKFLKKFVQKGIKYSKKFNLEVKQLIPYTFGIEYETSSGAIPEEECYKAGLIPLKDGSIQGNEYATIIQDSNLGFERTLYQTELLKKYTTFDKECSLHIHFGGFNMTPKAILILYNLCYSLQSSLSAILPYQSFDSELYKASNKNYCKRFPDTMATFNNLYNWLSQGAGCYSGDLTCPHPADRTGDSKWNIRTRYYWVNFVHSCFYKSPKTIEFRILRPSTNFGKITNWIYIFSALLQYAEKLEKIYPDTAEASIDRILYNKIAIPLEDILAIIYPEKVAKHLSEFIAISKDICCQQNTLFLDQIGSTTLFEDSILPVGLLESTTNEKII